MKMLKEEFSVAGMSCGHCKMSVEKALKAIGVEEVTVELEAGKVIVGYNDASITREMIIDTIEDAGYSVL